MVESTEKMSAAGAFARFMTLFKSMPKDLDVADVLDMWNQDGGEHKNPGAGQIVTGPAERASGSGAVKMVGEYSSPAPQQGLMAQYAEFQNMLSEFKKSLGAEINPILAKHDKALSALVPLAGMLAEMQKTTTVSPAAPGADTFLGKALLKITKARAAVRKADLADEDEKEERKSQLAAATDLLKSAKRLLAKASEEMEDTGDDESVDKAMTSLRALAKAVTKAEDEDKEKEDAAEKARAAVAQKALDDAAALKKAEDDKKEEEEAAEKAKAADGGTVVEAAKAVTLEDIQASLKGLSVLPTTLNGIMEAISGKSRNPDAPVIAKGTVTTVDFAARVDQALDNGVLGDISEMKALNILSHLELVKAGRMNQSDVDAEIAKSPIEVRQLFQAAA